MFDEFEKFENCDLKNLSTMKTGGQAKFVLFPKKHLEILKILKICKEKQLKHYVIGNCSNILFSDNGFDGVLISLKHFDKISKCGKNKENVLVNVGAGINLFSLNFSLQKIGLSGLEFCFGIPATLGGFLVMNGGCFGHEICEFVEEVLVLENGKIRRLKNEDCDFCYRHSCLENKIVLSAKLRLKNEKSEIILKKMQDYYKIKRENQPCNLPSLGSVFKIIREDNQIFPAKLIDEMGLKGTRIGDAEVSVKHAGFIVNKGNATSADVLALIEFLEKKLSEKSVFVEREIIVLKP